MPSVYQRQTPLAFAINGDILMVGAAGAILVAAGLLQKSLGDINAEEARLPPAAGAKARRESQRSKRFLKGGNPKRGK